MTGEVISKRQAYINEIKEKYPGIDIIKACREYVDNHPEIKSMSGFEDDYPTLEMMMEEYHD